MVQKASGPWTSGRIAKLKAGGGEAVDHSSDRPSHGSPVVSANAARLQEIAVGECHHQRERGLAAEEKAGRREAICGEQAAQLFLGALGDGRRRPFGGLEVGERAFGGERMSLAADDPARVREQIVGGELRRQVPVGLRADVEVDRAVAKPGFERRVDAFDQVQLDLGIAGAKGPERLRQHGDMRGDRQADDDGPARAVVQLIDLFARVADLVQHGRRTGAEGLPDGRQHHTSGAALEERGAEFAFQLAQTARQRRLRELEVARAAARRLPCSAIATTSRK